MDDSRIQGKTAPFSFENELVWTGPQYNVYVLFLKPASPNTQALNMESQMMQNSRNQIGLTFKKFVIKVKGDFNQAQQNGCLENQNSK